MFATRHILQTRPELVGGEVGHLDGSRNGIVLRAMI
jgi:hypothetical protein